SPRIGTGPPAFKFDVNCEARENLLVKTDLMDAELRGNFHLLGDTAHVGLLGGAEIIRGTLLFRETRFNLTSGNVKFELPNKIAPRFNVSGSALVKEQKS